MKQFAAQVVGIDGKVRIPSVGCFFQKIRNGYYYFQFDQPLALYIGDSLDITCLDDKRTQCLGISMPTTLLAINLPVDVEGEVKFFTAPTDHTPLGTSSVSPEDPDPLDCGPMS